MHHSYTSSLSRAQGCLMGQLVGDSLGSLVEFMSPSTILSLYPHGVRDMAYGGVWDLLPGQPTDDSELALILARTIIQHKGYVPHLVFKAYEYWQESGPFDIGLTTASALRGQPNFNSQSNGALMRSSPLGILSAGVKGSFDDTWRLAMNDAELTHPNSICLEVNALFVILLSNAISTGCCPQSLYSDIILNSLSLTPIVVERIRMATTDPPTKDEFMHKQGWVLVAFHNALYQLLHAKSFEDGVVDTISRGGDTDTNAAICGALLGAVHGLESIPKRWQDAVLTCRPHVDNSKAHRPRPECFWPVDAMELAKILFTLRE